MPPKTDRMSSRFDVQPKTPDDAPELVRRVLTNIDGFLNEDLVAMLRDIWKKPDMTLADMLQKIKEFPQEQMSFSEKNWFLTRVDRAFGTGDKAQALIET